MIRETRVKKTRKKKERRENEREEEGTKFNKVITDFLANS